MFIKQREAVILRYLLNAKWFISLSELAKMHSISERAIRYDIDNLNYFLKGLPVYIEVSRKGILLHADEGQKKSIRKKLESLEFYDISLTDQEKLSFVLMRLLTATEPVTIKTLAEELTISRGALQPVMKEAYIWLEKRGIEVIKRQNFGIELKYTEVQWRKAVIAISSQETDKGYFYELLIQGCESGQGDYFNPVNYTLPYYTKFVFNEKDLNRMVDVVGYMEQLTDIRFSDVSFVSLMLHLAITVKRIREKREIEISREQLQRLQEKPEYEQAVLTSKYLEKEFQIQVPDSEIGYLTLHLMGARREERELSYELDKARKLAIELVSRVEGYAGIRISLEYLDELVNSLVIHLQPAIVRIENDMGITNPLLKEIQRGYPKLFEIVECVCKEMEEEYHLSTFPKDEIAYLVMHIGGALEKTIPKEMEEIRVLIMCASGLGTAKMLSGRLRREFPQLEIIKEISLMDINQLDAFDADILITTLDLMFECKLPTVKVSPLLNEEDIEKIEQLLSVKRIAKGSFFDRQVQNTRKMLRVIENIVEKYGQLTKPEEFRAELYEYIINNQQKKEELPMLSELVNPKRIHVGYRAVDWEDAVREAGRLLVETGCAKHQYVDAMVQTVNDLGPYIVLAKGLALPHARPEAGAKKVAMSLVILEKSVDFGNKNNDPVKVVFGLCAIDNSTHVQALADLGKFAIFEENFNKLVSCTDENETYQFIKEICERENEEK